MSFGGDAPEFIPPDGFDIPAWLGRGQRKHLPEPYWTWEFILQRSRNVAIYHPSLSLEEIRSLEMETVRDEFEIEAKRKPHLRVYCRGTGRIIGASKGKPTESICVYYDQHGNVHGFPVTEEEIKRKEANR